MLNSFVASYLAGTNTILNNVWELRKVFVLFCFVFFVGANSDRRREMALNWKKVDLD